MESTYLAPSSRVSATDRYRPVGVQYHQWRNDHRRCRHCNTTLFYERVSLSYLPLTFYKFILSVHLGSNDLPLFSPLCGSMHRYMTSTFGSITSVCSIDILRVAGALSLRVPVSITELCMHFCASNVAGCCCPACTDWSLGPDRALLLCLGIRTVLPIVTRSLSHEPCGAVLTAASEPRPSPSPSIRLLAFDSELFPYSSRTLVWI